MLPQLAVFDRSEPTMLAFMQGRFHPQLSPEEAKEWHAARWSILHAYRESYVAARF